MTFNKLHLGMIKCPDFLFKFFLGEAAGGQGQGHAFLAPLGHEHISPVARNKQLSTTNMSQMVGYFCRPCYSVFYVLSRHILKTENLIMACAIGLYSAGLADVAICLSQSCGL